MNEKKELWKNKKMYGQFVREMPETDEKETWYWLRKADLKVETEAMLCAAQKQAIRTNYVKHKIDKTVQSPLCRMCDKKCKTMSHIVSECGKLAQRSTREGTITAIPEDLRVSEKEKEKIERYQELKRKIKRMWNIRSIKVIPVVVGAHGSTSKKLKKCIEQLGVVISIVLLQKTTLLGTAHILRKVLDCG